MVKGRGKTVSSITGVLTFNNRYGDGCGVHITLQAQWHTLVHGQYSQNWYQGCSMNSTIVSQPIHCRYKARDCCGFGAMQTTLSGSLGRRADGTVLGVLCKKGQQERGRLLHRCVGLTKYAMSWALVLDSLTPLPCECLLAEPMAFQQGRGRKESKARMGGLSKARALWRASTPPTKGEYLGDAPRSVVRSWQTPLGKKTKRESTWASSFLSHLHSTLSDVPICPHMVVPWVSKAYFITGLVVSQLNLIHVVVPGISIWLGGASALVQGLAATGWVLTRWGTFSVKMYAWNRRLWHWIIGWELFLSTDQKRRKRGIF